MIRVLLLPMKLANKLLAPLVSQRSLRASYRNHRKTFTREPSDARERQASEGAYSRGNRYRQRVHADVRAELVAQVRVSAFVRFAIGEVRVRREERTNGEALRESGTLVPEHEEVSGTLGRTRVTRVTGTTLHHVHI